MSRFIEINCLHPDNIEGDSHAHILAEDIVEVHSASLVCKKHRHEIKSIIVLSRGVSLATDRDPKEIMEELEDKIL